MAEAEKAILFLTTPDAPASSYVAAYAADLATAAGGAITTFAPSVPGAPGRKNIGSSNLAPDCVKSVCDEGLKIGQAAEPKIELVVALLASPIIVLTAGKIARDLGAELVTITADTMETMVAGNKDLAPFSQHLIDEFNKLIAQSTKCAAITSSGYDHITSQLHKPCELLPLPVDFELANRQNLSAADSFRIICHAPSTLSQPTFAKFVHALNRLAQRPDSVKIILDILGGYDDTFEVRPAESLELNRLGRLSQEYAQSKIAQANLTYICAPLEKKIAAADEFVVRRQQAEALQAGTSLLFHGQEAYCLSEVLEHKHLGLCVSDIGDQYIEQVLTSLIDSVAEESPAINARAAISWLDKEQRMQTWSKLI